MNPPPPPRPVQASRESGVMVGAIIELSVLVLVPAVALGRLAPWIDWRVLVGWPAIICGITYWLYWSDKRRAGTGEWRIPESTLHLAELAGGWPGAFIAQRKIRHKTSKISYQVVFWLIVLLHEFVALEFLIGWKLSKGLWQSLRG